VRSAYLALGDSYTIGEGVVAGERWPVRLAAAVREAGAPLDDPVIVARTGWTTSELDAALDAAPPADRPFALVSLLVGVNDQYRGYGIDVFRAGLARLLSRAVEHAGGEASRVILVSIPDWSVTPFAAADARGATAIASEIDRFNDAARRLGVALGARWADVTTASREAARNPRLLAADGLHPSAAMYASWVPIVLPHALGALGA
jgi:lysophospholipase L1-like esterase